MSKQILQILILISLLIWEINMNTFTIQMIFCLFRNPCNDIDADLIVLLNKAQLNFFNTILLKLILLMALSRQWTEKGLLIQTPPYGGKYIIDVAKKAISPLRE